MYYCDICQREIKKKIRLKGYTLCSKHMHQMLKYGEFKDSIPRTSNDLNEYVIKDGIAYFDVYNQENIKVNTFMVDADMVEKIKYKKWRADSFLHIVTGNCTETNPRKELTHLIMDVDRNKTPDAVIDHINGNTLDNRKCNLRVCTQRENRCNLHSMNNNTSGFIGISWDKHRNRWAPEIRKDSTRYHLGRYEHKSEAIYARYIAERILFGEYRNTNNDNLLTQLFKEISITRKREISVYVVGKINKKEPRQLAM